MRFYPQLTPEVIANLTTKEISYFYQAMKRMEAKDRLEGYEISSYPKREYKDQRKRHREAAQIAYPENFEKRTLKTSEIELV